MIRRLIILLLIVGCMFGADFTERIGEQSNVELIQIRELLENNQQVSIAVIIDNISNLLLNNNKQLSTWIEINKTHIQTDYESKINQQFSSYQNFSLIERNNIDIIIKEQRFQNSGLVSSNAMVEIGNLLGATHILTIDFSRSYGTDKNTNYIDRFYKKLVEVETGEILSSSIEEFKNKVDKRKQLGLGIGLSVYDGIPIGEKTNSTFFSIDGFTKGYISGRFFLGFRNDSLSNINSGFELYYNFDIKTKSHLIESGSSAGKGYNVGLGCIMNMFSNNLSSTTGEEIYSIYMKLGYRGVIKQDWFIDIHQAFPLYEYHYGRIEGEQTIGRHIKFNDYHMGGFITIGYLIDDSIIKNIWGLSIYD